MFGQVPNLQNTGLHLSQAWTLTRSLSKYANSADVCDKLQYSDDYFQQAKEAATQAGAKNLSYIVGDAVKLSELKSEPGFEAINGGCDLVYSHAVRVIET